MNTFKTRGLVLRAVKYGETSLVLSIYTELFGLQSYLVNGVRVSSPRGMGKANLFQPAALLDLVVYHQELKNLQRIKEFKWAVLYEHIYFDVWKNAVAMYMVELLQKTIKQPESNPDLFAFVEDAFIHLDSADSPVLANFPLFFSLHLGNFLGLRLNDQWSASRPILDLQEGAFVSEPPDHPHSLDSSLSHWTAQLLKVQQPTELREIKLNRETRRELLKGYQLFYALHINDFGRMKTLTVLQDILQ